MLVEVRRDTGRASFPRQDSAHVDALVTSGGGAEVAWHRNDDLLPVPHELRYSVLSAANLQLHRDL